jgi:hypothetical protein
MPAKTIDEVIQELDDIIAWAQGNRSRLGYFAAMYRKVTLKVKEGIADGVFENDFNKINEILAALVDGVERELARIWPMLKLLDRIAGKTDEAVINFSIEKARDHAWKVAEDLAAVEQTDQTFRINALDKEIAMLGGLIRNPGLIAGIVTKIIRLGERGTVPEIINILR